MVVVLRAYRSLRGQGALLALITGIVGAAMVPVTVGAQPAAKAGSTMPAVEYSLDQSELGAFAIGDRLKVTLFERYAGGDGRNALSSLVEVSEVAGEYTVGQNGAVFLPLLGDVQVLGLTQAQLRAELIERFKTIHRGDVEVSVRISEREPIYVTGAVAESGSFKYTPGMTVLHALALAQGLPSAKADVWRRLDVLREQERMRKSDERLANLQARYAVLEAESLGQPTPESAALAALIGKERAKEKIAKAVHLRELERSKLRGELAAHDQVLTALERELALLREGLQNSEKALAIRSQRVETAANLRTRGVTTDVNVAQAQNDLTIAQERWNETRTAIARVERSIAQQRQEKMRAGLDEPLERERELTRVRAEMAEETVTKDVIARMLSGIPEEVSVTQDTELNISVVRRGASGVVELRADEYSPLLPGDLVKVLPRSRAISAARARL